MYPFKRLIEAVNRYKEQHKSWPTVTISRDFWNAYADEIADLAGKGVDITVVDDPYIRGFYFTNTSKADGGTVDTLYDLKEQVENLIDDGKGHWPVRFLPHDARVYLQIKLLAIIPGSAPVEGLELRHDFADAPEGEHILVLVGQDDMED